MIRNNPGAKQETDDTLELAEIMRILISDLASSITQSRVDNLYKTMELTGKAPQLLESANKPLFDQEKLDTLVASKKTERKPRKMGYKKPFLQRHHAASSFTPAPVQNNQASTSQPQYRKANNKTKFQNFQNKGKGKPPQ
ncbi:hypothetical protein AYI68_g2289 [Smittium mucronatum]|uniref:Uncharacterized protein n=1 Tax=Smittium mucronatum TaxID=133383 RepID=A0A1R0H370_9FUNG|nr:hypothetical protein AYI68_g2289 [Smittium mucronatum]